MSKGKATRKDATQWVYNEHRCAGSYPGCNWSAERSKTSRDSGADVVMAGAGVAGTAKG
jgi:hypothetical protein